MATEEISLPPCGKGPGVKVRERAPGVLHKSDRAHRAARRMRRAPTYSEQKLWKAVRQTAPHFRRQAPFGSYLVDFVCHAHRLERLAARDAEREAWLIGRGYRVVRVSSDDAAGNPYAVVERILSDLGVGAPTPNPSPQGGGGH